jgi:integrase
MARARNKLSVKKVASEKRPGYYSDGDGLYLQVSPSESKSWIFRYTLDGRAREMGLGSVNTFSLAEARTAALKQRQILQQGIDPIEARDARMAEQALARARSITFGQSAERCINAKRADWKNVKHAAQWTNTIQTYAVPVMGETRVQDIDTGLVLKVLEPIWTEKPETATRLRARIEAVLDWATARGHRKGENPARWRGHLDKLLPALKKKSRVKHHPALPYEDVAAFMRELRKEQGTAARALELTILTCTRTGEVIAAEADEFDLGKGIWTIPEGRMKGGKSHQVPLSPRAIEIISGQPREGYVFPGLKAGQPLSNMAMLMLLARMGRDDITVHGFRSSFRDWAAEKTGYPNHVVEQALAHTIGNAVEAAYRRGDLLEKRKQLMIDWASYCERRPGNAEVLPLKQRA